MTADLPSGLDALKHGCALVDRGRATHLELTGADRQRFLNGLVTCDVKTLAAGQGCYGFFTDGKGRVLADVVVLVLADRLRLLVPAGQEESIAAHLRKYIIADRVEASVVAGGVAFTLAGPRAAEVFAANVPVDAWASAAATFAGCAVLLVREGRLGVAGVTCWVAGADADVEAVRAFLLAASGAVTAGVAALDVVRIEAGIGRWGRDFGAEHFPQETGAEAAAVSYSKGCYLGQEVVARIHYRGGVQRALRGLRFEESTTAPGVLPAVGSAVLADGRESGELTSVTRSDVLGTIGLAVLHQRVGEAGARVALASGELATLAALPFVE